MDSGPDHPYQELPEDTMELLQNRIGAKILISDCKEKEELGRSCICDEYYM